MFKESKEGLSGAHAPHQEGEAAQREVLPKSEEQVESHGTVGNLVEAIRLAPPNAVIFVSGLEDREYEKSLPALKGRDDVTLVEKRAGKRLDEVTSTVKERMSQQHEKKVVANLPEMFKHEISEALGAPGEDVEKLLHRAPEDAAAVLLEWLARDKEENKEGGWESPVTRLKKALHRIMHFADGSDRPVMLMLPANSPLVLAFLTVAVTGSLTREAISSVRGQYPMDHDAVASLQLKANRLSVLFGQREIAALSAHEY